MSNKIIIDNQLLVDLADHIDGLPNPGPRLVKVRDFIRANPGMRSFSPWWAREVVEFTDRQPRPPAALVAVRDAMQAELDRRWGGTPPVPAEGDELV